MTDSHLPEVPPDDDGPCDCELPGSFCSGVPGILAAVEQGKVAPGAVVQRCDACERFESDEAARARLVELEMLDEDSALSLTENLYRVGWEIDVQADSPRQAAEEALAIQRRRDSTATVFEVVGPDGKTETVDLLSSD